MAISWGGFVNHLQVGIEVWTDGYDTYTPSVNVYAAFHVHVDSTWNFADDQSLVLGGNANGTWGYRNNLGANGAMYIGTFTVPNQGQSYGGGPTYTFSASVAGLYLGAGPSHSVQFTLPPRPKRVPAPPSSPPAASKVTSSSASLAWGLTPDDGGSALISDLLHVATDSGFANIVQAPEIFGASSTTVSNLAPGTKYWTRAFVRNSVGWSGASATSSFTTATRPANAPGSAAFSNITATGFTAAWAASTDYGGATPSAYRLQVATDSGFATVVSDTQENNRSRAVTGLVPGKKYYTRVLTINSAGSSAWSATTSVDTAIRAANAPGTPAYSGATATGMTVSWTDSTDYGGSAPTGYRLQVAAEASFANPVYDQTANNRSRVLTGLTPGQIYYARALTVNGAGSSAWSPTASGTTGIRVATAPGNPLWSDVTPTTATVSWADSSDYGGSPPTGYRLVIASDSGFASVVYDNTAANRTRAVSGLAPGTTYYARVLTVNDAGSSPWSATIPATTAAFGTSGIAVSAVGPDTATISWATPVGAVTTGYQVQYATDLEFTTGIQTVTGVTWETSRTLTGLAPATTYFARVRANTDSGYGAWSDAASFQTLSGAKVRQGGQWVEGVAYVRQGGQWVIAKVYKRKSGAWVL